MDAEAIGSMTEPPGRRPPSRSRPLHWTRYALANDAGELLLVISEGRPHGTPEHHGSFTWPDVAGFERWLTLIPPADRLRLASQGWELVQLTTTGRRLDRLVKS